MITVHHLNNSRSQRILWLLEELGLEYQIKRYQRNTETMLAPDELKKVHPLGKSPVIVDDGTVVAESGAIIEYLLQKYGGGRLRPKEDSSDFLRYRYWLHFAEGSAMPPLLLKLIFSKIESAPMPFFAKPIAKAIAGKVQSGFIRPNVKANFDFMESELGKTKWFAGDEMTGADIQMSFPLEAAADRAGLDSSRPNLMNFLKTIHERPAYKRALEKGGDYAYAKT